MINQSIQQSLEICSQSGFLMVDAFSVITIMSLIGTLLLAAFLAGRASILIGDE